MLMAFLAVRSHRKHVDVAQTDGFRCVAAEMYADVTQLGGKARFVAIHARGVAVRGSVHRVDVVRPSRGNLRSPGRAVRCSSTRRRRRLPTPRNAEHCDEEGQRLEESHHERNAVPFQLRTSAADA